MYNTEIIIRRIFLFNYVFVYIIAIVGCYKILETIYFFFIFLAVSNNIKVNN